MSAELTKEAVRDLLFIIVFGSIRSALKEVLGSIGQRIKVECQIGEDLFETILGIFGEGTHSGL